MRDGRRYAFILQTITVFLIGITPIHIVNAQDNESCFECHNEALLEMSAEDRLEMLEPSPPVESGIRPEEYLKYNKPFALLSLAIDQEKYEASVHSELECITCHEDIEDIPHKQHLQTPTACCNCHDEEIAEAVEKSVHGKASEDKCAAGCIGCHDPHYGKSKDFWSSTFEIIGCLPCHESCTTEPIAKHDKWLSQARLHLTKIECDISKVGCVACHVPFGKKKDPHRIVSAKLAIRDCSKCHSSNSFLFRGKSSGVRIGF